MIPLLQNQAFLRIFRYGVSCYGVHANHTMMSLLFNELLETAPQRDSVLSIFKANGWSEQTKGFPKLSFKVLRTKIIPAILSVDQGSSEIRSCMSDESMCNHFIHVAINTYDHPLLNTFPKRVYPYEPSSVYPALPFSRLQKEQPDLLDRIFSLYRYNEVDDFIRHQEDISCEIYTLRVRGGMETQHIPHRALPHDEHTFDSIIEHRRRQTMLPFIEVFQPILTYTPADYERVKVSSMNEGRFLEWLTRYDNSEVSEYLEINLTLSTFLRNYLNDYTQGNPLKAIPILRSEMKTMFSQVIEMQGSLCDSVATFLANSPHNDPVRKKRFTGIFRHVDEMVVPNLTQESLSSVLETLLTTPQMDFETVLSYGTEIQRILTLVSSEEPIDHTDKFAFHESKTMERWKIAAPSVTRLNSFCIRDTLDEQHDRYDLLLHNRIFLSMGKDRFAGFQSYSRETPNASLYLRGLAGHLNPYLQDMRLLQGGGSNRTDTLYTNEFALFYIRYHLMVILQKTVEYIEGIQDETSEISRDANDIYVALEEQHGEWVRESVRICSLWLIDVVTHICFTHFDPLWIAQNKSEEDLQRRLSKQKEREKQSLITTLDSKSNEERILMMQMQQAGLSNFYKETSEARQAFAESEDYAHLNDDERREYLQNLSQGQDGMSYLINGEVEEVPFGDLPDADADEADAGYTGSNGTDEDEVDGDETI
jgi:hypothetical protein